MANIEIRFNCSSGDGDYLKIECSTTEIEIVGYCDGEPIQLFLDKSTAIKFAKTLRTEINKIQD